MPKLNCILKIRFNNDELTLGTKEFKTLHTLKQNGDIRICCQARILTPCLHTEMVRKSMFKKYFKILLVSSHR